MKKSSKTTVIIAVVVITLLGFLFIMFSSQFGAQKVSTTEFFRFAGITYEKDVVDENGEVVKDDKGNTVTEKGVFFQKPTGEKVVEMVVIDRYVLKGYRKEAGKYYLIYQANLYPSDVFAEEIETLKINKVVMF